MCEENISHHIVTKVTVLSSREVPILHGWSFPAGWPIERLINTMPAVTGHSHVAVTVDEFPYVDWSASLVHLIMYTIRMLLIIMWPFAKRRPATVAYDTLLLFTVTLHTITVYTHMSVGTRPKTLHSQPENWTRATGMKAPFLIYTRLFRTDYTSLPSLSLSLHPHLSL